MCMSQRLQVLLEESEMEEVRQAARRRGLTVAAWVRAALREARQEQVDQHLGRRLQLLRRAAALRHPIADIGQINAEIERGYLT